MKKSINGFTLIELIIVVTILGILATIAIPRYIEAQRHAREAVVEGLAGSIKAAVSIIRAHCVLNANQCRGAGIASVNIDGASVDIILANKRPANSESGIGIAANIGGVTAIYPNDPINGVSVFMPRGGSVTCRVTYSPSTGAVIPITTDCA